MGTEIELYLYLIFLLFAYKIIKKKKVYVGAE